MLAADRYITYEDLSDDSQEEECIQMKNSRLGYDAASARPESSKFMTGKKSVDDNLAYGHFATP